MTREGQSSFLGLTELGAAKAGALTSAVVRDSVVVRASGVAWLC